MNSSHAVMNAMIAAAVNTIINSVNTNIDVKSKNPVLEQDQIDPNTYPIAMFTLSVKDYCSQLLSSRDSVNVTMEAMVHTKELDEFASGVYCNFEI